MASQYLQIGNAVPIALAEGIGRAAVAHLETTTAFAQHTTSDMLEHARDTLRASARNKRAA